jgi:carbon storage regulator
LLILTRRMGEGFVIGNEITVTVVALTRNQVRLGVSAPRDVEVYRQEIHDRVQAEKALADR